MTKYTVALVTFPFDDFSSMKVRPAVCLTDEIGEHKHIVVAFISSRIPDATQPTDLVVRKSDDGFQETGLQFDSVIKLHRLITVPPTLLKRRLGTLPEAMQQQVSQRLKMLFGL